MHREARPGTTTTAAIALLLCGGVLPAQESVATTPHAVARDTLRGLDGVHVVVEELRPEAVDDGLSKEAIEEGVVQRLWDAGVRVLMEDQWTIAAGAPYLYLNVNAVKSKDLYVYAVDLQLNQNVKTGAASNRRRGRHDLDYGVPGRRRIGRLGAGAGPGGRPVGRSVHRGLPDRQPGEVIPA